MAIQSISIDINENSTYPSENCQRLPAMPQAGNLHSSYQHRACGHYYTYVPADGSATFVCRAINIVCFVALPHKAKKPQIIGLWLLCFFYCALV
jgi:hypothetical protein